ncbi:ubiquitin carboxyl-terminal hydrolase 9X-like isoform X2 [Oscarella lobularis]|uniref:ubiquitin carboxyl-terminal hydrolase 9X-like isoform X2 n=1 Tax=Oscarella lobularis TaxID=121494 RepID=UPI0033139F03
MKVSGGGDPNSQEGGGQNASDSGGGDGSRLNVSGGLPPLREDEESGGGGGGGGGGEIERSVPPDQPPPYESVVAADERPPSSPPPSTTENVGEADFPVKVLQKLDDSLNRTKWIVPVTPRGDLEVLLLAAIQLCKRGLDSQSEPCQRFFRDGLYSSFVKILTDEAVCSWKAEIQQYIQENNLRLVQLCVLKLNDDVLHLLDLLAMVLSSSSRFHLVNNAKTSENSDYAFSDVVYAKPTEPKPKGWLVDLVNAFGSYNGFDVLRKRVLEGSNLNVQIMAALIRPFGGCADVLTLECLQKYVIPCADRMLEVLESLTDDDLKKEAKNEAKNDAFPSLFRSLKVVYRGDPDRKEMIQKVEEFRMRMILRLLQISSFNGKMNALNEVNKMVLASYGSSSYGRQYEEDETVGAETLVLWIKKNEVLTIVLRDNLHQPQYVEKLEKILQFMIRQKALNQADLDAIWAAQAGKHDAIVKNIHDLLAKLAWNFSAEQLDHLFHCFQESWVQAGKRQREKLIELIRRLAEDDKDGVMAGKVLGLLWNLAHSEDCPTEIMDQALNAHIKILDYSCAAERDQHKSLWLERCLAELKSDTWVLPAIKMMRDIFTMYIEAPHGSSTGHSNYYYRQDMIQNVDSQSSLIELLTTNLECYMSKVRKHCEVNPGATPEDVVLDGRTNHEQQVNDRLTFLKFVLKDGRLYLSLSHAIKIWTCLAKKAVFPSDREACFKWFSKVMGEDPDLEPLGYKQFFEDHVMNLDPALLTESGMKCFDRAFKLVNQNSHKLIAKRHKFVTSNLFMTGIDYIWKVILCGADEIVFKAIELMKDVHTHLSPTLLTRQVAIHVDFIGKCFEHLETSFEVLKVRLEAPERHVHVTQMVRCLTLLREYIAQCDDAHKGERTFLPHGKSSLGKHIMLTVRFPLPSGRQEDLEVSTHGNESLGALRRKIIRLKKGSSSQGIKIDLFLNGEVVNPVEDRRLMHQLSIRERAVLSAKIRYKRHGSPSQDSSSDSSTNSPPTLFDSTSSSETEQSLPGVIMARDPKHCSLLLQIGQMGSQLNASILRDRARELLDLIPSDQKILEKICQCKDKGGFKQLEEMCFQLPPLHTLYHLEVLQSLLLPATSSPDDEQSDSFQLWFIENGGIRLLLKLLESPDFVKDADVNTRKSIYHVTIRLLRLFLASLGMVQAFHWAKELTSESPTKEAAACGRVEQLREALLHLPSIHSDLLLRQIVNWIGQSASKTVLDDVNLVTLETVCCIQRFAWSAAAGAAHLAKASVDAIHKAMESKPIDSESASLCKESLEVLSTLLALQPNLQESLIKERDWQTFIIDLLLMSRNRPLRLTVCDQLFLMVTRCSTTPNPLRFLLTLLFTDLSTVVSENERSSSEYFTLLCKLLSNVRQTEAFAFDAYHKLKLEVEWLKKVKADFQSSRGCTTVEDTLLEGRLKIAKELLQFQPEEVKRRLGSAENGGENLVQELVEEFLCPASKQLSLYKKGVSHLPSESMHVICSSHSTQLAAYDLLVVLCCNCIPNMERLCQLQDELFYSEHEMPLMEWEYMPPIGARPIRGFVGLKNAGATCYMNSVLQMLFMVPSVRDGILKVKGLWKEGEEEEPSFVDEKNEKNQRLNEKVDGDDGTAERGGNSADNIKAYRLGVVKQVQCIFGHLMKSRLQYYTPRGLWKAFRMGDRPVNVREQQDAMEFFNGVVDCIDEGLKTLGHEEIVSKVLGGSFADQKICKGCPHRYAREEKFMSLSVDIRYHGHLLESLEQYVKGDLLEGDNAYFCEKCNRKVDTVKRMCIKSLPPVLMIQLKRFGYDWERDCAVKFNDYMEVPRELDMEPYTVDGLAKIEGERVDVNSDDEGDDEREKSDVGDEKNKQCTKYSLAGVVVHSGQASGGHYYSFIMQRLGESGAQWYKFEDGEVSEAKMDDDEELKAQCFGGEFVGETYDHVTKRMQYRRQKRWWNGYLLFYERVDSPFTEAVNSDAGKLPVLAGAIERGIQKENLEFMHLKALFSIENFRFMRSLVDSVAPLTVVEPMKETQEKLVMLVLKLLTNFLLSYGLRTKKAIRGLAGEWVNSLLSLLKCSKYMRFWFATSALFRHPERFVEYLLECPNQEVRTAFSRLLAYLAYFSHNDGPYVNHSPVYGPASSDIIGAPTSREDQTLSDCIVEAVLNLLNKEVGEHERHISQYFYFFLTYCSFSHAERSQLLKMRVPALFIALALGEGPALIGYRHHATDLSRLYSVVSVLVRCYDVSRHMQHCVKEAEPAPNPFYELSQPEAMHPEIVEALFENQKYLKKVISENAAAEDTLQLFQFLCWENPTMSRMVLTELLYQITYAYAYELRPYLDLLYCMLMLDDSWQHARLLNCVRGFQEDQLDGILDIIRRSTNNQPKRSYQCIKMLVNLFTTSRVANELLKDESIYRPFKASVDWLGDELDKRPYGHSYSYNNWSPPAQSNESSNGYFLERSNSARQTLTKAYDLLPEDEQDEAEPMVDDDVPESESPTGALDGTVPEMSQYHNSQSYGGTSSGADQSEPDQSSPERVTWARDKSRTRVEFSRPTKTTSIDNLDQIDNIPSDSPGQVRNDETIGEADDDGDDDDDDDDNGDHGKK